MNKEQELRQELEELKALQIGCLVELKDKFLPKDLEIINNAKLSKILRRRNEIQLELLKNKQNGV